MAYIVVKDIVANRYLIVSESSGSYSAKAETNSQTDAQAIVTALNA